MNTGTYIPLGAACLLLIIMSGCTGSQPTRFYVLSAVGNPAGAGERSCPESSFPALGILPVELPKYLDRPQMVTRKGENELRLSELHEWAEPLDENIADVVAQNLRSLTCSRVETFPWRDFDDIVYRISATVVHLDGTPGGQARLDVVWSVTDEETKRTVYTKESRYVEPVRHATEESLASAYSRLLASFSRDIADALASKRIVQVR